MQFTTGRLFMCPHFSKCELLWLQTTTLLNHLRPYLMLYIGLSTNNWKRVYSSRCCFQCFRISFWFRWAELRPIDYSNGKYLLIPTLVLFSRARSNMRIIGLRKMTILTHCHVVLRVCNPWMVFGKTTFHTNWLWSLRRCTCCTHGIEYACQY